MRKKLLTVSMLTLLLFVFLNSTNTEAMTYYENVNFVTGMVTASALNVRCGPGTKYKSIGMIYKNEYVDIKIKIGPIPENINNGLKSVIFYLENDKF